MTASAAAAWWPAAADSVPGWARELAQEREPVRVQAREPGLAPEQGPGPERAPVQVQVPVRLLPVQAMNRPHHRNP